MNISKLPPLSPSVIRRILFYLLMLLFCQQLAMIFWRIGLPDNAPVASVQITPAQARQQPVTLNDFTLFGVSPEKNKAGALDASQMSNLPPSTLNLSLTGVMTYGLKLVRSTTDTE